MARTVGIGIQNFGKIIENNCFYVDKTAFIKEWWDYNGFVLGLLADLPGNMPLPPTGTS